MVYVCTVFFLHKDQHKSMRAKMFKNSQNFVNFLFSVFVILKKFSEIVAASTI